MYRSAPTQTTKTRKVHKPITLYPATEQHPAQTQLIQVDETIGTWDTVHFSGAVTAGRKKVLQERVRALLKAVKFAREEANTVETSNHDVGRKLFAYLLA
jgi:ABC-type sulfate transport system substrate-binding protein